MSEEATQSLVEFSNKTLTKRLIPIMGLVLFSACSPATPPATAESAETDATAAEEAKEGSVAELALPEVGPECEGYIINAEKALSACQLDANELRASLGKAFELEGAARDQALFELSQCSLLGEDWVLALRAELAPVGCADAMIEPVLNLRSELLGAPLGQTLQGLALAAKLYRLDFVAPVIAEGLSKEEYLSRFQAELSPWVKRLNKVSKELSVRASKLRGYGRGVAAVASAHALLGFVDSVREIPIPKEIASDEELKEVYYASLEDALEPYKNAGKDAALAALSEFGSFGILQSDNLMKARELLTKLFAGKPVNALDAIRLPNLPNAKGTERYSWLAAIPPYYLSKLIGAQEWSDPALWDSLSGRIASPAILRLAEADGTQPEIRLRAMRAAFQLGQVYWAAPLFESSQKMATSLNGKLPKLKNELALYESLSSVLKMGPRGVRELMNQGTWSAEIRRYLGAIDEIAAAKTGEMAAMAEFDAALLLRLAVDLNSPADYYEDLASRFLRASSKSSSAELKEESARYAKEAKDIAAFIRANPMVGKANTDEAKNADGLESAQ